MISPLCATCIFGSNSTVGETVVGGTCIKSQSYEHRKGRVSIGSSYKDCIVTHLAGSSSDIHIESGNNPAKGSTPGRTFHKASRAGTSNARHVQARCARVGRSRNSHTTSDISVNCRAACMLTLAKVLRLLRDASDSPDDPTITGIGGV